MASALPSSSNGSYSASFVNTAVSTGSSSTTLPIPIPDGRNSSCLSGRRVSAVSTTSSSSSTLSSHVGTPESGEDSLTSLLPNGFTIDFVGTGNIARRHLSTTSLSSTTSSSSFDGPQRSRGASVGGESSRMRRGGIHSRALSYAAISQLRENSVIINFDDSEDSDVDNSFSSDTASPLESSFSRTSSMPDGLNISNLSSRRISFSSSSSSRSSPRSETESTESMYAGLPVVREGRRTSLIVLANMNRLVSSPLTLSSSLSSPVSTLQSEVELVAKKIDDSIQGTNASSSSSHQMSVSSTPLSSSSSKQDESVDRKESSASDDVMNVLSNKIEVAPSKHGDMLAWLEAPISDEERIINKHYNPSPGSHSLLPKIEMRAIVPAKKVPNAPSFLQKLLGAKSLKELPNSIVENTPKIYSLTQPIRSIHGPITLTVIPDSNISLNAPLLEPLRELYVMSDAINPYLSVKDRVKAKALDESDREDKDLEVLCATLEVINPRLPVQDKVKKKALDERRIDERRIDVVIPIPNQFGREIVLTRLGLKTISAASLERYTWINEFAFEERKIRRIINLMNFSLNPSYPFPKRVESIDPIDGVKSVSIEYVKSSYSVDELVEHINGRSYLQERNTRNKIRKMLSRAAPIGGSYTSIEAALYMRKHNKHRLVPHDVIDTFLTTISNLDIDSRNNEASLPELAVGRTIVAEDIEDILKQLIKSKLSDFSKVNSKDLKYLQALPLMELSSLLNKVGLGSKISDILKNLNLKYLNAVLSQQEKTNLILKIRKLDLASLRQLINFSEKELRKFLSENEDCCKGVVFQKIVQLLTEYLKEKQTNLCIGELKALLESDQLKQILVEELLCVKKSPFLSEEVIRSMLNDWMLINFDTPHIMQYLTSYIQGEARDICREVISCKTTILFRTIISCSTFSTLFETPLIMQYIMGYIIGDERDVYRAFTSSLTLTAQLREGVQAISNIYYESLMAVEPVRSLQNGRKILVKRNLSI